MSDHKGEVMSDVAQTTDPTPDPAAVPEPPTLKAIALELLGKLRRKMEAEYGKGGFDLPAHWVFAFAGYEARIEAARDAELDRLRARVAEVETWKRESMAVESEWDCQAVDRELGLRLGTSIRREILPAVMALKSDRDALAAANARLTADLAAIRAALQTAKDRGPIYTEHRAGKLVKQCYDLDAREVDALLAPPAPDQTATGGPTWATTTY